MQTIERAEFTNVHKDTVTIALLEDSFKGFHLIVKVSKTRRHDEKRVVNGVLVDIPTSTHTLETKHVQLPDVRTALVEFKLYCTTNNMPGFGMTEFQAWLIDFNSTEQEN